jgi:hypothetical protein
MTASTKLSAADLSKNARLINAELKLILEATEASAQHAITAGQILKACKDSNGHGEWEKWLGDNCPDISTRTASYYMRLAKHEDEVEEILKEDGNRQRIADLSASAMHALIPKKSKSNSTEKKSGKKAAVQQEAEPKPKKDEIKAVLEWAAEDDLLFVMKIVWDDDRIKKLGDFIAVHLEARAKAEAEREAEAAAEDPFAIPAQLVRRPLQQPATGGN